VDICRLVLRDAQQFAGLEAMDNLALMYAQGQGVPQDNAQAVAWNRKAADQGDADAQYNLGVMHRDGQGVAQDYAQALAWYRKAADQGFADAQHSFGVMYAKAKAWRRTMRRPSPGSARPQNKASLPRSTASA
jgi:TPR repeat protein